MEIAEMESLRVRARELEETLKQCKKQKGLFVVAPSGAGKSYYVESHKEWTDQDPFLAAFGEGKGELSDSKLKKDDKLTFELKQRGAWIMGATWWDPRHVDAFVVPPEATIKARLKQKEDKFPDSYYEDEIKPHIENDIKPMAKEHKIPIYTSFEDMCIVV